MGLDKLQTTYQTKLLEYETQAQATATILKKMKDEKQADEDSTQLGGVDRIGRMVTVWRHRTKASINDCWTEMWMQWSHQAVELQVFGANAENRKNVGDDFYKMDEESIVTILEELLDDFFSLAESHLKAVRRLVESLHDDQLGTNFSLNDTNGKVVGRK